MLPNHKRAFLIPPLFPCTPAGCDAPATTKIQKMCAWKHKQRKSESTSSSTKTQLSPFISKFSQNRGKQSCCSGQFFLQIEQRQANVGQKPVQGQSQYWYSLIDREGCQFRQPVHRQTLPLCLSLFIYFVLLVSFSALFPSGLRPFHSVWVRRVTGPGRRRAPVKTKRVGGSLSHSSYPSLLYTQPRWQGITFVNWTCTL